LRPLGNTLGICRISYQRNVVDGSVIVFVRRSWDYGSRTAGAFVHEENDLVILFRRQRLSEYLADFPHGGSLRRVSDDDVLVLQLLQQGGKFFDVHVFSGFRSVGMLAFVKCALGDQDFAFGDIV